MTSTNKIKNLLNSCRQKPGSYHTHVSMIDQCKGIFSLNRQNHEDLWTMHSDEITTNPDYISGLAEKPQNYSMLRSDIDQKEETDSTVPYKMYSTLDAVNLIKDIQQYLKENIKDCKPEYLDCALLKKSPYISTTPKGTFNKHGYHLQFVNCFLSKDDNSRLADHFHRKNNTYDKIHNHPWLLYGSQKKKETGRYHVSYIFNHEGKNIKPEEYFNDYKIYDHDEKLIKFTKPVSWYYPRIFSINLYNRELYHEFKPETTNRNLQLKKTNFCDRQESSTDLEEYDNAIQEIIAKYISEKLDGNLEIKESSDTGYKLVNKGPYVCPIDPLETHSRMGAFINIFDGGVFFGCYKCRDITSKCTVCIGRFKNSTYNGEFNFKEILSLDSKARTKEQKVFIDGVFEKMVNNNTHYLFNVKGDRNRIEIEDNDWVSKEIMKNREKCVLVKAGLGRGKTQASTDYINESSYEQIIIFTPRRSYARCALDRMKKSCPQYDWKLYMDDKKRILEHPYIICQAESLNRLSIKEGVKTLILIDEVEAFLCQLTSTKTNKENHIDNIEMFMRCMSTATKIICLDAFISQRTLQTIKFLNIRYKFYDYVCLPPERKCLREKNIYDLMNRVNTDLIDGKKIYFFCSSITKITDMIYPALKREFPDKKILIYNSNNKKTVSELINANDIWSQADLVLTTSTITVGCNFDIKNYFHKVYCYASATSRNYVRDMFQSLYRVRHLIDNELVYAIDDRCFGMNLPTSKKKIETTLKDKILLIENQYKQQFKEVFSYTTPQWLSELIIYNTFEYNVGIMNLENLFQRYLKACNYVHPVSHEMDVLVLLDLEIVDKIKIFYVDIPDISVSGMNELKQKKIVDSLSALENAMWEKYWFKMCVLELPKEVEQPLWEIYCDFNKGKFRNMCVEKGMIENSLTVKDLIQYDTTYSGLNNGYSMKVEMIQEIKKWLGITNSQEFDCKITREKVESVLQIFEVNKAKIHTVFDLNADRSKKFNTQTCVGLINKVFTKWGFSQMKKNGRKKKCINGKEIDITPFNLNNINVNINGNSNVNIDVFKYIKAKKVRQRQLESEYTGVTAEDML